MAASTPPLRILYVEDNALVRELTCELLAREGRQLTAVATAEEALLEYQRQPFDILITDVSLPKMSGLDLARSILSNRPATTIIFASGYSLGLSLDGLGPNVHAVTKPFKPEQIDVLIKGVAAASA
jgi:CheY-like chemotaxis protein